jgi:CheY-like chemotaxis protein
MEATNANYRVLSIDDDAKIHQTFKAILLKFPIEYDAALSANEALEKIRAMRYNLILLDIIMPETDGIAFLESASGEGLFLPPVIVVSSATDKAYIMQALSFGASSYLFKPIDVSKLRAAVSDYLGLSAVPQADETLSSEPFSPVFASAPSKPVVKAIAETSPAPSLAATEFTSISRAMGHMVFHRRTAMLEIHTKVNGIGALRYENGKLKSVSFNGISGIDALEAMKSVEIQAIIVKG